MVYKCTKVARKSALGHRIKNVTYEACITLAHETSAPTW